MINLNKDIDNIDELKAYFEAYPEEKEFYPQTINELKVWYIIHNLPDEQATRFFIGKGEYYEPRSIIHWSCRYE